LNETTYTNGKILSLEKLPVLLSLR